MQESETTDRRGEVEKTQRRPLLYYYLVHFPKRSIAQFSNYVPYFLGILVSVDMLVLLLLLLRPKLEDLAKIEERHLPQHRRGCGGRSHVISAEET